jgi:hypothetical protein
MEVSHCLPALTPTGHRVRALRWPPPTTLPGWHGTGRFDAHVAPQFVEHHVHDVAAGLGFRARRIATSPACTPLMCPRSAIGDRHSSQNLARGRKSAPVARERVNGAVTIQLTSSRSPIQ